MGVLNLKELLDRSRIIHLTSQKILVFDPLGVFLNNDVDLKNIRGRLARIAMLASVSKSFLRSQEL